MIEKYLGNNNLNDADDFDALIDLAALTRELVEEKTYPDIITLINYLLQNSYYEAFSWCMEVLQEEFEKEECTLENFECPVGKSIPGYDEFIERLDVDLNAPTNGIESVDDKYGEVESFYNILVYRTKYDNINLVSSENFDNKDNDFVEYKLSFFRD